MVNFLKAIIVKAKAGQERAYSHYLIIGNKKYPGKVVNFCHVIDLKDVVSTDALVSKDKKVAALKEVKFRVEKCFKIGKNMWFFTKLEF